MNKEPEIEAVCDCCGRGYIYMNPKLETMRCLNANENRWHEGKQCVNGVIRRVPKAAASLAAEEGA